MLNKNLQKRVKQGTKYRGKRDRPFLEGRICPNIKKDELKSDVLNEYRWPKNIVLTKLLITL